MNGLRVLPIEKYAVGLATRFWTLNTTAPAMVLLVLGILLSGIATAENSLVSHSGMHMDFEGDRLTVQTKAVPLSEVLTALSRHVRLEIVTDSSLDRPVTISFRNMPMIQAVQRILSVGEFSLLYIALRPGGGKTGNPPSLKAFAIVDDEYFSGYTDLISRPQLFVADDGIYQHADAKLALGLSSTDPSTRARSAILAADSGIPADTELIYPLLNDQSPLVREAAIEAVVESIDSEALPYLASMASDESPRVRRTVMELTVSLDGDAALSILISGIDDHDSDTRQEAIGGLVEMDNPVAIQALNSKWSGTSSATRIMILESLYDVSAHGSHDLVRKGLRDTDPSVRIQAVYALEESGDPNVLTALELMLLDPDIHVRMAAAEITRELTGQY